MKIRLNTLKLLPFGDMGKNIRKIEVSGCQAHYNE